MKSVRFTKHFDIYNSGEIAGFEPKRAAELVKAGVAVYVCVRKPATLDELVAEVKKAGYKGAAIKQIAQDRFDGKYGDAARYLRETVVPEAAADDAPAADDSAASGEPAANDSATSGEPAASVDDAQAVGDAAAAVSDPATSGEPAAGAPTVNE